MPWSSLANNQAVSDTNLKDAVDTSVFSAGGTAFPSPTQNKEVTKSRCSGYITVPNPDYPTFALKESNQIIVKGDIYAPGDFTLDPLNTYYRIDSVTCTGIPSFSYPVTSNTTLQYNGTIPVQTMSVSITYIGPDPNPFDDATVTLYVNGGFVAAQAGLLNGGTASLYLPNLVASPSSIRIAVSSGSVPANPNTNISFSSTPVNSAAISKTTGQYQFVTEGLTKVGLALYYPYPDKSGFIYRSSDYGVSWNRQSSYFNLWKKIVCSNDGQYVMAIPHYGYPMRSTDYGVTFSNITSLGQKYWSGVAMSTSGDYVTLTGFDTLSSTNGTGTSIYRSTNYGASWSTPTFNATSLAFSSVAMSTTGQYQVACKIYARVYYSSDYGATWSDSIVNSTAYFQDLRRNDSGSNNNMILAYVFASGDGYASGILQSTNNGSSWSATDSTNQGFIYSMDTHSTGTQYAALYHPSTSRYIKYRTNSNFENLTSAGQERWQCFAVGGGTTYMLAGYINGLKRSGNSGSTWDSK